MTHPETSRTQWLNLMDFANEKKVSLSTLRRYIKSNKVPFKFEAGKYLLPADLEIKTPYSDKTTFGSYSSFGASGAGATSQDSSPITQTLYLEALQEELKRAHEEIAELKTLIALYEDQKSTPTA